jgi:hypothetical protein
MSSSKIDSPRSFSLLGVTPKNVRVVKPVRSRKEDEDDGETPKRQPQPQPGTGEMVDKSV